MSDQNDQNVQNVEKIKNDVLVAIKDIMAKNGYVADFERMNKVDKGISSMFSTGRVTTGFSWTGTQTKDELLEKLGECGFTQKVNIIDKDEEIGENILPEEMRKYAQLYDELATIYSSLPNVVFLKKSEYIEKGHNFDVYDYEGGALYFSFSRTNYLPVFDQRMEVQARRTGREKVKLSNTVDKLKKAGFSKEDLMAMLANL